MTLFASDKQDLEHTTDSCRLSNLYTRNNTNYTCANLVDADDFGIDFECNYISTVAWIILIQNFLLVKLFLNSLLTAMFSATGQRISAKAEQLWMFQRYEIVLDYEIRSTFPPPFTFLSYGYNLITKIWNLIKFCWEICWKMCFKKNWGNESKQQKTQ